MRDLTSTVKLYGIIIFLLFNSKIIQLSTPEIEVARWSLRLNTYNINNRTYSYVFTVQGIKVGEHR